MIKRDATFYQLAQTKGTNWTDFLLCVKDKMKLLGGSSKANKQDLNIINAQKVTLS